MEEPSKQESIRDEQGRFPPGVSGNPNGRPVETEERKLEKRIQQQFIDSYVNKLIASLDSISPILIKKAQDGDMVAIKELHDRAMGKAPQSVDLTSMDEKINNPMTPEAFAAIMSNYKGNKA